MVAQNILRQINRQIRIVLSEKTYFASYVCKMFLATIFYMDHVPKYFYILLLYVQEVVTHFV